MPVAAVVADKIIAMHGGLSPELTSAPPRGALFLELVGVAVRSWGRGAAVGSRGRADVMGSRPRRGVAAPPRGRTDAAGSRPRRGRGSSRPRELRRHRVSTLRRHAGAEFFANSRYDAWCLHSVEFASADAARDRDTDPTGGAFLASLIDAATARNGSLPIATNLDVADDPHLAGRVAPYTIVGRVAILALLNADYTRARAP